MPNSGVNGGPVCTIGTVLTAACKPEPNARQTLPAATQVSVERERLYSSPASAGAVQWFWSRGSPHAQWRDSVLLLLCVFVLQAMAHHLPSCIVTMRVLKDICRRVPAWGVLDQWVSPSHFP